MGYGKSYNWVYTWLKNSVSRQSSHGDATSIGRLSLEISATFTRTCISWQWHTQQTRSQQLTVAAMISATNCMYHPGLLQQLQSQQLTLSVKFTKDHRFLQIREFWAKPQNLPVSVECCRVPHWPVIRGKYGIFFVRVHRFRQPQKINFYMQTCLPLER